MIPVTKPFLPPEAEYQALVQGIWQRNWLTNNGPLASELELRLKDVLQVPYTPFVGNGTIALQLAIKALELKGEIITTPFSYVATTSAIVWEGRKPVFADIHPETLTIDPEKIEEAITPDTSAILATHVCGNPCHVEEIQEIADRHSLKVIYDAAHCFDVTFKGKSIFLYGDISTVSFHATKPFHTIEGGAVFSNNPELIKKMAYLRNFGHRDQETFFGEGINGKNSEFHAAMGLCNLNHWSDIKAKRKTLSERYLKWQEEFGYSLPLRLDQTDYNFAYFPVILESEEAAMAVFNNLKENEIFARRYFFPTLNTLPYVEQTPCPVAEDIASRVLCLPLYTQLTEVEVDMICRVAILALKYREA